MPCDYGSRHARPIDHLNQQEQEDLGFDNGQEIYVRKILNISNSPDAINTTDIARAASNDKEYEKARSCLREGKSPDQKSIYSRVWNKLCVVEDLILKEDKIIIPDAEIHPGSGNLRETILDIAHDGHPGAPTMKRYIRSRVWFPDIDKRVEEITNGCLPCQASTPPNTVTP